MLIPFQPNGSRPPLFMVHGTFGLYTDDDPLIGMLGPEQPVYGITAPGFVGGDPPCESVPELAALYAREIVRAYPSGRYFIGGMCKGCIAAIETARTLAAEGRDVGPVLLLDPGLVPYRNAFALESIERGAANPKANSQMRDIARASVRMLAERAKRPLFDRADPVQLERAMAAGFATSQVLTRFVPAPFHGPTELIICSQWSQTFFEPDHDWQRVIPGPRTTHVLEGSHMKVFVGQAAHIQWIVREFLEGDTARTASTPRTAASYYLPNGDGFPHELLRAIGAEA